MNWKVNPALVLIFSCVAAATALSMDRAQIIDRLIAVVNGAVITEGDLRVSQTLNAVSSLGAAGGGAARTDEIRRLVDLELLRQELANFKAIHPSEAEIRGYMDDLREAYAELGGLGILLQRLGLTESELLDYVDLQLSVMKFVDYRFRPFISVSDEEKRSYYDRELVPRLRRESENTIPPFPEVSEKIEEVLSERKITEAMERWLAEFRSHAQVEIVGAGVPADGDRP